VLVPRIHDGEDQVLLLVTGLDRGVFAPRGRRVVTVSRSPGLYLNFVESPARVTVDQIVRSADGARLTVSGPRWPGVGYDRITWRRFLPDSDDSVDAPCAVTVDDERWTAETDATTMAAEEPYNWTLFACPGAAAPYAVVSDNFLLARLPLRVGTFVLRPRGGALHLETD
jgi:CDP-glycerol glycerophosphotransferase